MRLTALVIAALAITAGLAVTPRLARAGDPTRVYRTLESEHFVVYYYEPLVEVAQRAALVAEHAHRTLVPALDHEPAGKTILVIVDDTDGANGFANTLPRNAITIFATGPNGFTELDDHEDWLYGLIAHEYTHILHLDTIEGLPTVYNKIFGKTWSPNQILPRWVIEGIAVYEESKHGAGGRNRGTRFDQYLRIAERAGEDLRLDEISGAPRRYPRGNAAYVYGSHFLRYIFDRFGGDTLRQMSHLGGSWPVPFAINRQIAKVTGEPYADLYGEWKGYLRDRYSQQEQAAARRGLVLGRPLTHTAEVNHFAHYSADGRELVWQQSDGYHQPWIRAIPVGGTAEQARNVVQIDAMGPFDLLADGSLVFEQGGWLTRREYSFQELMRWDATTKQTVRLTHGRRAREPAVSPDGRRIAFSKNLHSTSVLAVMAAAPDAPDSVVWQGGAHDEAYQPCWSPDGQQIVFSPWRDGGYRDIAIVELASGAVTEVTHDRAIDTAPSYSADGRTIYFDSDRTGISNIYAYDVESRQTWQVTNVVGGAFRAHASPDGRRLAFDAAAAKGGYDLFEIPLDRATWLPARAFIDARPEARVILPTDAPVSAPRPYRALETLAPQTWTLATQLTADHPSLTVTTAGSDAVGIHSYQLSVGTALDNGDLNIGGAYSYNLFRNALRVSAARTISQRLGYRIDGVSQPYRQEDWSATLSTSIPFESRPESSWSLSFDYDLDWFRLVETPDVTPDPTMGVPLAPVANYVQAGVATRVGYSSVRGVSFGLGPQRGFDASVGLRFDHPYLGAEYRNVTVSYAASTYRRLWGQTPVLFARITGGMRAGDLVRSGSYGLGGIGPQDVVRSIIDSTRAGSTGYLRGYKSRAIVGNQYHLLNLEYRQELWRIERGVATLPVYVRRLHGALLSDTGAAWDGRFSAHDHLRTSVGAALRLDAYFGYFVGGTFELGISRGLSVGGITEAWFLLTGSL